MASRTDRVLRHGFPFGPLSSMAEGYDLLWRHLHQGGNDDVVCLPAARRPGLVGDRSHDFALSAGD